MSSNVNLFSQINNDLKNWDTTRYRYSWNENKTRLEKIYSNIKKTNDFNLYSNYFRRLGILYAQNGEFDSAQAAYITASEYNIKTNDLFSAGSNVNSIGVIQYELKNYKSALNYFLKAYDLYDRSYKFLPEGSQNYSYLGKAEAGGNISEIYTKLDSFELALKYAQLAIDARYKSPDTSKLGRNLYAFGYLFEKQQKTDSSLKYYFNALKLSTLVKDFSSVTQIDNGIGRAYYNANMLDSSIKYYNKALDTAKKYNYRPLLALTYGYLSVAYERMGNANMALLYLKGQQILNNEMLDSATVKYITDANSKYGAEAQNRINTELKADKERQTLWMAILISIIISIVIISALIIWINYNKRRLAQKEAELQSQKVNDLLQKQEVENVNAMLKGQDAERKRIAQELHDRLGSILSTVKLHFSAVEEQMNALKEQQHQSYGEATMLLDEAVDEVRRISHDLYEGSLAKFGFKTALLQLIAAIEKANTVKILFIDNGVDEGVYKDYAQELYRITQELLSNTLKYSGATEITLQLSLKENTFDFMYEDNGKGFDKKYAETNGGIGYKNIAARVAKLNGSWHLDTHPGHGMTLLIEIPV
ncbi:MAG: histidine kinase [Bacteroidota bacterium]